MVDAVVQGFMSYVGTISDYFIVLMIIFGCHRLEQKNKIMWGSLIGNGLLVGLSIIIGMTFKLIPAQWVLGLLGIIPIIMGIRVLVIDDDDDAEIAEKLEDEPAKGLITTVALLAFSTCGADNMAVYIPYFANLELRYLPIILLMFLAILISVSWLAFKCSTVKVLSSFMEKYAKWLQSVLYIALGCYILIDTRALQELFAWL
ncbi:permease [Weissella soli]|uniref:CadD family cadmium resistance transporter n=1 Tax=Weissella soli TaxID=155866 RepID=UPI0021C1FC69|nr:CadD family cadmium resistance transporter [Weissella soli]MCT8395715.1 permease [Weissella soli]